MKMVYGNGEILLPRGNETAMLRYRDFLRILGHGRSLVKLVVLNY